MKVTVIGGGSTYTPELVNGFLTRFDEFPIDELWLVDIDPDRLDIVGGFTRRLSNAKSNPFEILLTTDRIQGITNADYVITQFRVGMMEARKEDEYLAKRHSLIGQETTGIGGMAKALRTIPVILEIADEIKQFGPDAILVNFTNPAGIITEALSRHAPTTTSVGVCNVAVNTKMSMIEAVELHTGREIKPETAFLDSLGLNHLTWHRGFTADGLDLWPVVMETFLDNLRNDPRAVFDPKTIECLGMVPNYYLEYYYYTDVKLRAQDQWPPSRAEEVMVIEDKLLKLYSDPDLTEVPEELMERGGAYYSTMATQLLSAHWNDSDEIHIVNVPNNGSVKEWPFDWVLEIPCRVNSTGIQPLKTNPLPDPCFGLIAQVKAFEILTVEAAVHNNRTAAYQALLAHPLGPNADKIDDLLNDLIEVNKQWIDLN